jgi:hypothetical protein
MNKMATAWSTPEMAATIADDPRIALGFQRMALKAPSRISPTVSGRSGTIPGFGAYGRLYPPYCP